MLGKHSGESFHRIPTNLEIESSYRHIKELPDDSQTRRYVEGIEQLERSLQSTDKDYLNYKWLISEIADEERIENDRKHRDQLEQTMSFLCESR